LILGFLPPQKCFTVLYYYFYTHNNFNIKWYDYYNIFLPVYLIFRVFWTQIGFSYCFAVQLLSCGFYYPNLEAVHDSFSVTFLVFTFLVICWVTVLILWYDTAWWCGVGNGLCCLFNGSSSIFVFCLLVLCDTCIKNQVLGDGVIM
jgi:hypothetical protein